MADRPAPTKDDVLGALRDSGAKAVTALRAMDAKAFESGRYENGWNARQILAHVAAIEWTYARLLDVASEAPAASAPAASAPASNEVRRTSAEESGGVATRPVRGGIDDYNARQVEKRAGASVAELIDELEANRARTIAAVEGADAEMLSRPIRSSGGITGSLGSVLMAVAVEHVNGHVADITGEAYTARRW